MTFKSSFICGLANKATWLVDRCILWTDWPKFCAL